MTWLQSYRRPTGVWRDLARLQRQMDRLYRGAPRFEGTAAAPAYPALNVWLNEDGAMVTAELPGIEPDDIDISVVGETLTVRGSRTAEELPEGAAYHRRERGHGRFSRTFQLPFPIATDDVDASFANGVLTIMLPRHEADKPRRIEVKAS